MPRTETVTMFSYDELNDESKKVANQLVANQQATHNDMSEELNEFFEASLEAQGYPIEDIGYSFSHSQGDGMAFYGHVDIDAWLTINCKRTKYRSLRDNDGSMKLCISIIRNDYGYSYSHYNTMSFDWEEDSYLEFTDKQNQLANALCLEIEEHARALSKKLEREAYQMIEYREGPEYAAECLSEGTWDHYFFNEDGTIY